MKNSMRIILVLLLVCILGASLTGCYPSGIAAAKNKLVKAGYTITDITAVKDDGGRKILGGFRATNGTETIIAVKYSKGKNADDAYMDTFDLSRAYGFGWSGYETLQHNNWIFCGTDTALIVFKK